LLYRNTSTHRIAPLPWRVRMPDGTTRTDPAQWSSDPAALAAAGYEATERNADDDAFDAASAIAEAKASKLAEIEAAWESQVAAGWTVPGESYALGIAVDDVALLLGAYTLARDAAALGLPDEVAIIDTDGNAHQYNSQTLTPVMLQYGSARATLSGWYASLRQTVAAATTLEEVADIEVT
jgi:hypothetical protein